MVLIFGATAGVVCLILYKIHERRDICAKEGRLFSGSGYRCFAQECPVLPGLVKNSPYYRTTIEQSKQEGVSLLNANKGEEAYALYIRLLREQPEDPGVNLGLARAAMMSGRYTRAIMAYERLIERYPSQPEFYTEISAAYMALGDRMMADICLPRT